MSSNFSVDSFMDNIEKKIIKACREVVRDELIRTKDDCVSYLKSYYNSYKPIRYVRTMQLYKETLKGSSNPTSGGAFGKIFFTADNLDYSMKKIRDPRTGKIYGPYTNVGWSGEKTLESAMEGLHGGHRFRNNVRGYDNKEMIGYTPKIWSMVVKNCKTQFHSRIKKEFIDRGIPVLSVRNYK